jgi:hypothetical protein
LPLNSSLRAADHAQEDHLLFTELLDFLTSENTTDVSDQVLCSLLFFLLLADKCDFALLNLPLVPLLFLSLLHDLSDSCDTGDTLASTLVRLDQADGHVQVHIDSKDVMNNLHHCVRLFHSKSLLIGLLHKSNLFLQSHLRLWGFLSSLFLLLLLGLLLFLFLARAFDCFLEQEFDLDVISLLSEIARNRNFDDAGVVFQIEQ